MGASSSTASDSVTSQVERSDLRTDSKRAGLRVLDRNWRSAAGEIDIVAAEGQVLVVCEVKTRSGTGFGTPLEAIIQNEHARLRRLAAQCLVAHGAVR